MKKINILILFFISILTTVLWRLFLPLNDEFLEINNIEISEIPLGVGEIFIYFLIALLVSFSFIFPFLSAKNIQPIRPYWTIAMVTILTIFIDLIILDNSIKGIYLVRYMGDHFPFSYRIISVFIFTPVVLFLIIKNGITHLKIVWILPFFLVSFLLFLAYYVEIRNTGMLSIKDFRSVVSKGHFLFYGTFLFGLLSLILANTLMGRVLN